MLPAFIIAIALFAYVAFMLMLPYGTVPRAAALPRCDAFGGTALPLADAGDATGVSSRACSPNTPRPLLQINRAFHATYGNQTDLSDLTDQLYFPAAQRT